MRTLYYQPAAGISGDMHLAALIDLGVDLAHIESELAKLSLSGEYKIACAPGAKMGVNGTQVTVHANDQHSHRHHSTIVRLIEESSLETPVARRALAMFEAIAHAEAKIHNIPVSDVHFHEVGAIDSIVDIVGAAVAIEALGVERIVSAPVEVGSGYVNCAHGRFPVPAPATQEILSGVPCVYGTVDGEATTPTGAAILKANVHAFAPQGEFVPERVGYGVGHKDFAVPNVLRAVIGETVTGFSAGEHYKIEANIDDMSAEALAHLLDRLLTAGASDAYCTPIVMKKSRPAQMLCALVDAAHLPTATNLILNESSTIGLRVIAFEKQVLPREIRSVTTSLGRVAVKVVTQPNGRTRFKVEHDDIVAIAAARDIEYQSAKLQIDHEVQQQLHAE